MRTCRFGINTAWRSTTPPCATQAGHTQATTGRCSLRSETFAGARLTLPGYLDVEARHLVVLASFLEESGTTRLVAVGVEDAANTLRVEEGAELSTVDAIEVVRQMLREEGWCRLEDDDRFYIHVGWDYYLYVGSERPCEESVAQAKSVGLFVDGDFPSPYLSDD